MQETNVYAAYNFNYNFSLGDAYLSNGNFNNSINQDTFVWTCTSPTQKASVVIFYNGLQESDTFQLTCVDLAGNVIPGTEQKLSNKLAYKSQYTFISPLQEGDKIIFKVTSNLSSNKNILVCNATVSSST